MGLLELWWYLIAYDTKTLLITLSLTDPKKRKSSELYNP